MTKPLRNCRFGHAKRVRHLHLLDTPILERLFDHDPIFSVTKDFRQSNLLSRHIERTSRIATNLFMANRKMTPEEIARNIEIVRYAKQWIKKLSLTQAKIAEMMGVSEPTVSMWFQGKQTMSAAQVVEFAQKLNISVEELLSPPGDDAAARRTREMLVLARTITDEQLAAIKALVGHKDR